MNSDRSRIETKPCNSLVLYKFGSPPPYLGVGIKLIKSAGPRSLFVEHEDQNVNLQIDCGSVLQLCNAEVLSLRHVSATQTDEQYTEVAEELQTCREVASLCSSLKDTPRDKYARNLLNAFLPEGYADITPQQLHAEFTGLWERFGLTIASATKGS